LLSSWRRFRISGSYQLPVDRSDELSLSRRLPMASCIKSGRARRRDIGRLHLQRPRTPIEMRRERKEASTKRPIIAPFVTKSPPITSFADNRGKPHCHAYRRFRALLFSFRRVHARVRDLSLIGMSICAFGLEITRLPAEASTRISNIARARPFGAPTAAGYSVGYADRWCLRRRPP
jgi:hypothetical protein